jgi:MFS family permease
MTADCLTRDIPQAPPRRTGVAALALRLPVPVAFVAAALTMTAFFFAAGAPTPLLVLYQRQWGFAPSLLTLAFGAYAIALLAALLVFGSLSDHVGRRPVLAAAVVLEAVALVGFLAARGIGWVIAARVVQGLATGLATSAFGAAVLELAPRHRPRVGPGVNAVAAAGGLGLGALVTGALAAATPSAAALVWGALAALMLPALLAVAATAETAVRRPRALASLVPRVAVPLAARPTFRIVAPALAGAWMLGALFMGLGPTILGALWGVRSLAVDGATASIDPLVAAVTALAVAGMVARRALGLGVVAVVLGAGSVVVAVTAADLPLLLVGGAVGGFGFGATFSGALRSLAPLAEAHERGGMLSAMYVVSYLAFGVPAIVAGRLVATLGLMPVVVGFGGVVLAGAALALVMQVRFARR